MDMTLKGKVAIVTGGTRGIGGSIAEIFLEHGAKVVASYLADDQKAESFSEELKEFKTTLLTIKSDITTIEGRNALFKKCLAHFNRIDILVNNAGVLTRTALIDMPQKDFNCVLNTNLVAPYWLTQEFAKQVLLQKSPGVIINISSIDAFRATGSMSHYEIAKAGLSMLTKSAATELAKHNIRVNAISPGLTQTDINREQWTHHKEIWRERIDPIPMKRAAKPIDIANAALFLASEAASYISGADLVIDGALTNYLPWYAKSL